MANERSCAGLLSHFASPSGTWSGEMSCCVFPGGVTAWSDVVNVSRARVRMMVFIACEAKREWRDRSPPYFFASNKSPESTPSSLTMTGVQVPELMTDIVPRKVFPTSSLYFLRYSGPG